MFNKNLPIIEKLNLIKKNIDFLSFITKTPPAAVLLKKAAKIEKGSGEPNREKVGKVTREQIKEIAQLKMVDLNANDIEMAMRIIEGTARSMGIIVTE